MYFSRVKRASSTFTTMPKKKMSAAWVPKSVSTVPTMASLFGTTPCTSKACWNMSPNGVRAPETTPAPAASTRNPTKALIVPLRVSETDLRWRTRPSRAIRPMITDGSRNMSTRVLRKLFTVNAFPRHDYGLRSRCR